MKSEKNNLNKKMVFIFLILLISIIFLISLKLKQKKSIEVNVEPTSVAKDIEIGTTFSNSKKKFESVKEYLRKREELIVLENPKDQKDLNQNAIKRLEDEGIKTEVKDVISKLKELKLLTDEDKFSEKDNKLFIGKISDNEYSYEIIIKDIDQIIKEKKTRKDGVTLIPLDQYYSSKIEDKPNNSDNTDKKKEDRDKNKNEIDNDVKNENDLSDEKSETLSESEKLQLEREKRMERIVEIMLKHKNKVNN